jgi:hypothetical protein
MRWAFYSPSLQGLALSDFLSSNGYDSLTTIGAGSGFWVKAKQGFAASWPTVAAVPASVVVSSLRVGWNLVAFGEATSASQFNAMLGPAFAATGGTTGSATKTPVSVWAWDSAKTQWYFYSGALDAQVGTALQDFSESAGYLDFNATGKSLTPATGFWVNIAN